MIWLIKALMDLNDRIAVAACHVDGGRRIVDLLRKRIASGEGGPVATLPLGAISIPLFTISPALTARCRIARVVKPGWLRQDKVAI
jgi:hypothetical protein